MKHACERNASSRHMKKQAGTGCFFNFLFGKSNISYCLGNCDGNAPGNCIPVTNINNVIMKI